MKVVAYLTTNATVDFPARDINHAREIAKRIVTEGLWVVSATEESEEFYPITQVWKAKIVLRDQPPTTATDKS